jgi:hypothetical protein
MRIFKEEQKFTQIWLHALLIVSFVPVLIMIARDWIQSTDHDSKVGLITVIGSILLVYGLIYSLKLKTRIDEKGIYYRFIPFHLSVKFISWDDLKSAYIRKYNPISEYGGWGIKGGKLWNKSNGVAFNVKGDIGLQLELISGKKILIGTQQEEEIKRVLMTYADKITNHEN